MIRSLPVLHARSSRHTRPRCHPEPAAAGEGPVFPGVPASLIAALLIVALLFPAPSRGQHRSDFSTPTPLASGSTLIVGFLDRAERLGEKNRPVVQLADRLRALGLPAVYVELAEHSKHGDALKFIEAATGRDSKGRCTADGCREVRLLLYGRGDGGAAAAKLARELKQRELPVALAVLVDCTGAGELVIPTNVAEAANLYQNDSPSLRAPLRIRAEDPAKTKILANQRFTAGGHWVDLSDASAGQPSGRALQAAVDADPLVWNRVEDYILDVLHRAGIPGAPAPPH